MLYSMMKKLPLREMAFGSGMLNIVMGTASLALARPMVMWAYSFLKGHPEGEAVELVKLLIKIYIAAGMLMIGLAMLATAIPSLRRLAGQRSSPPAGKPALDAEKESEALRDEIRVVAARHEAIELEISDFNQDRRTEEKRVAIDVVASDGVSLGEMKSLLDDLQESTHRRILVLTSQGLILHDLYKN